MNMSQSDESRLSFAIPRANVISLILRSETRPGHILLGVRRDNPTNHRHVDFLSTPTQRMPAPLFDALSGPLSIDWERAPDDRFQHHPDVPSVPIAVEKSMAASLSYAVESLMSRKLGLADALVSGRASGRAKIIASAREFVGNAGESDMEDTFMIAVDVLARDIPELGPTQAYRRLDWVPVEDLAAAVENRDPLALIDDETPWSVCLYGLCVRTAAFATPYLDRSV